MCKGPETGKNLDCFRTRREQSERGQEVSTAMSRDSGIERGKYVAFICFLLSFLLWLEANKDVNKKKK